MQHDGIVYESIKRNIIMAAMTCAILLADCDHPASTKPASNGAAGGCSGDGTNRGGHVDH